MNWDKICTHKEDGGLSLKKSRDQNNAMLMKLAFGVLTRSNELWVRVLRKKYREIQNGTLTIKKKSNRSHIWSGISRVWEQMLEGVLWKVKDGRTCRFWTDSWLEEGCVLSNEVDITVWEDEEEAKVADFVIDGGEDWDWSKLQALPDHLKF
jgi:hypothetical protein